MVPGFYDVHTSTHRSWAIPHIGPVSDALLAELLRVLTTPNENGRYEIVTVRYIPYS